MSMSRVAGIGWLALTLVALAAPCVSAAGPKESKVADKAVVATPPVIGPEGVTFVEAQMSSDLERAASVRIEKTLDEPTEIEVIQSPLNDVVENLKKRHRIEIQFATTSLEEAGIALDTCITRNLKGVSLRSALRLMLRDLELTYLIRDEVLLITTVSDAETIFTTRVYPVGDLLSSASDEIPRLNPAAELIEVIAMTVAPTTWYQVGGGGAASYLPTARSLVISQTIEVHEQICGLLAAMRKVQAATGFAVGTQAADGNPDKMFVVTYFFKPGTAATQAARQSGDVGKASSRMAGAPAAERNLADDLARAVPEVIEVASWKNNGGQGTIESIGIGVIVRQTRRVHHQVLQFLQPFGFSTSLAEVGPHGPIVSGGVSTPF